MTRTPPSLRLILGATFGGLVLLLVMLLSLVIGFISARQIQQDAKNSLASFATYVASELNRSLYERYREIIFTADSHEVLHDSHASHAERRAVLETLQQSYLGYDWIGLADATGTVRVATGGVQEGADVSALPWFHEARSGLYVGDTHAVRSASSSPYAAGEPLRFVDIAAPVLDDSGAPIGVLSAQLNWAWAQEIAHSLLPTNLNGQQIDVFIVDPAGEVLFGPVQPEAPLQNIESLRSTLPGDRGAQIEWWPDGNRYVTGYAFDSGYREYPGLRWSVLVRQPIPGAFTVARRTQWQILAVGSGFAVLSALVTWLLAGHITRPLLTIAEAAERVRRGEPGATIPRLSGSAEVVTLSASLNQLITDLTAAAMTERNRIARDLHDSVTQTLFSASMLADVLPRVWEMDPERGREKLEELRRAVRGALAEMRTLLLELRPAALGEADMEQLLRQLAEATTGRAGVMVTWQVESACDLPPDVKVTLYRTVQEALNNVAKHAEATSATITLRCAEGRVELCIRDNGHGFAPDAIPSGHFGLGIMRERIETVGGTFHLHSQLEQGTEIGVVWPCTASNETPAPRMQSST